MSVATRLVLFGAVLGLVFLAAFGVGRALGPSADDPPPVPTDVHSSDPTMDMGR